MSASVTSPAECRDRRAQGPSQLPHQVWNANITVNEDPHDPTRSPTQDYLIAQNILHTTTSQGAAIRIDADRQTTGIVIKDNLLRGQNRAVKGEGEGREKVTTRHNE